MVYASPAITHENVFENAFLRAEQKIKLMEGEDTFVYNTWRSEEMRGQPVTNPYGRQKVELERIDDDEEKPRWEKVLRERFPEKLVEIYQRSGERKEAIKETLGPFAEKGLGERAKKHLDIMPPLNVEEKEGNLVEVKAHGSAHSSGWSKFLGNKAHKQFSAVRGMVDSFKGGSGTEEVAATAKTPPTPPPYPQQQETEPEQ